MRSKWCAVLLLLISTCAVAEDYKISEPGYTFAFPRDYFSHDDYQTEWWYYTGNVKSADGHRFGYELTFFRQGVARGDGSHPWFVNNLWMAHIALSDVTGQRFYREERLNRSGPGVAGVDAATGFVWNGNWQAHIAEHEEKLHGIADKFGFDLDLKPVKQPVIQGQNGASQKGEGAGHASQYFSLTRLLTTGSIALDGKTYQVEGSSWMDHEFFTASLATNETGWDWLSVQLDDGTELMLYRLRHKNGSIDPYSSGSYVDASGKSQFLSSRDFTMVPDGNPWISPASKAAYPVQWRVSIPRLKLEMKITTPLRSQELVSRFGPTYWEGAIDVDGSRDQSRLHGVGYLELTGYAASTGRPVLPM